MPPMMKDHVMMGSWFRFSFWWEGEKGQRREVNFVEVEKDEIGRWPPTSLCLLNFALHLARVPRLLHLLAGEHA